MSGSRHDPTIVAPFGIRPADTTRILAHGDYRLLVGRQVERAVCGALRIAPGVAPDSALALHLEDEESGERAWFRPLGEPHWEPGCLRITGAVLGLELHVERLVVPGESTEVCFIHVRATGTRRVRLTVVRDVAFDGSDAFDSHPAFSKLFLQTARIDDPPGIVLSRRPRSQRESHPVLLFAPLPASPRCTLPESAWCETDRSVLFGRRLPYTGGERVPTVRGTTGNVLDPVLAIQVELALDPGSETGCAFLTSVAGSEVEMRERLAAWQPPARTESARVHSARTEAAAAEAARLERLGLSPQEAAALESLGASILTGDPALRVGRQAEPLPAEWRDALLPFGAAPEVPFLVVHLAALSSSERALLPQALRYWSELGLGIHAVVVHEGEQVDLPDSVSVVNVRADRLDARTETLLERVARLVLPLPLADTSVEPVALDAPAAPVEPEAPTATHRGATGPPILFWPRRARTAPPLELSDDHDLELDNGFGGFTAEGREYLIHLPAEERGLRLPPRPWTNVIANPRFGCIVSEAGAGTTWFENSREHRVTPWRNDAVLDPHDEPFFLLDEETGNVASAFPGPLPDRVDYRIRHGFGYTVAEHMALGLQVETLVFVAERAPYKVTRIRVKNPGRRRRTLSISNCARLVLGPSTGGRERFVTTAVDREHRALLAWNPTSLDFPGATAFATAIVTGTLLHTSFTCERRSVLGESRDSRRPEGLAPGRPFDGRVGAGLDACFAQRFEVEIEPEECAEVAFVLGMGRDLEEARQLALSFADEDVLAREHEAVRESWRSRFAALQIETPSRGLDILVNGWLPYQTIACRLWARSAFYQSGGAFGFRDQLQDASSLLSLDPVLTQEQILLHAGHQFEEGDVLHWWHPPTDVGLRTRFVDDLLWLPLLTATYVEHTGDEAILSQSLPFLRAPQLEPGEAERFLRPAHSDRRANLYEHCCLAIDRSLHKGPRGLPLFGSGDWNDGMNRVGIGGKGESVWMGFFLVSVIDAFLPHVRARGDDARAARYLSHRAELVSALDEAGWDGAWYRRGYYDDGAPLGSKESDECRIDALVQAWAVLSGVAGPERARQAMESAERELVSERDGLIRLLTPAFQDSAHDPGYIKGYVAGVRENGGQYTHAALWLIRAFAALGRRDRVAALLEKTSPWYHAADRGRAQRYQLEPYVVAADIYGVDPHVGRGGWSWYTGSSGWMSRVVIESLLGFTVHGGREARLAPVVPDDWASFRIVYRRPRSGTRYEIRVENPKRSSETVVAVEAPGLDATVDAGAARFSLVDDGKEHVVRIVLGPIDEGGGPADGGGPAGPEGAGA